MDFARNERGFCVGFVWNLILFSFVREREGYKHHADCTVCPTSFSASERVNSLMNGYSGFGTKLLQLKQVSNG